MEQFDYIIVGAGSAGCVMAERLSADGRRRVLLLEAGGDDRRFWVRVPIGYGKTYVDPRVNWCFHAEPDPGIAHRASYWPRGKVLGGSSSINAMVYFRGQPADFDDWRSAGNPGWGWEDVQPVFESFERRVAADGSVRGTGPLWVCNREREYHPIRRYFYDAARELGLPLVDDMNGPEPEGIGPYAINTRKGLRCSAATAFLWPARRRGNLCIRTNALVERILFDGRRAIGVRYRNGGQPAEARAAGRVILCAGAVNSPQILQLSGIGPADLLREMGIEVRYANASVGGGLQDHLGISYFYVAAEPTLNQVLGTWSGRLACGLRFLLSRSGPLSLSVNQIGGIVRTAPEEPRPNVQLYFNPLSYSVEYVDKRPLMSPDPWPGFIIGFNACRPASVGRIRIASPDPAAAPRIEPNYLSADKDVTEAIACARLVGRIQETKAVRRLLRAPPRIDLARAGDQEILEDFRARSGTVFHPCGTCRMAPEERGGGVDGKLSVYGVDGLSVADASIFPNITSANTNAPTIMVAHKAARLIAEN